MINRFALIQTCPQFYSLLFTPKFAAKSKSASFRTIKGSLPPSSSVVFFKYLEAVYAIMAPVCELPVNETPRIR